MSTNYDKKQTGMREANRQAFLIAQDKKKGGRGAPKKVSGLKNYDACGKFYASKGL